MNVASRMESSGVAGCVQLSASACEAAGLPPALVPPRATVVKGKGTVPTHVVRAGAPEEAAVRAALAQLDHGAALRSRRSADAPRTGGGGSRRERRASTSSAGGAGGGGDGSPPARRRAAPRVSAGDASPPPPPAAPQEGAASGAASSTHAPPLLPPPPAPDTLPTPLEPASDGALRDAALSNMASQALLSVATAVAWWCARPFSPHPFSLTRAAPCAPPHRSALCGRARLPQLLAAGGEELLRAMDALWPLRCSLIALYCATLGLLLLRGALPPASRDFLGRFLVWLVPATQAAVQVALVPHVGCEAVLVLAHRGVPRRAALQTCFWQSACRASGALRGTNENNPSSLFVCLMP